MILSYTRVSTREQAADGSTSLAEQERKNRAIALMRGVHAHDFVCYVDAGVSGSIPLGERPDGKRMLDDARPGDCIVATKMDRLFRSATDALNTAADLKKRKIDLVLIDMGADPVTANGTAKMFFGMLALVAEFERERIAERMADGRGAKKRMNGCLGAVPYGWRKVGVGRESMLEPDEREQQVVALAKSMCRKYDINRARYELAKQGFLSRNGKMFHANQLQRMLERPSHG